MPSQQAISTWVWCHLLITKCALCWLAASPNTHQHWITQQSQRLASACSQHTNAPPLCATQPQTDSACHHQPPSTLSQPLCLPHNTPCQRATQLLSLFQNSSPPGFSAGFQSFPATSSPQRATHTPTRPCSCFCTPLASVLACASWLASSIHLRLL